MDTKRVVIASIRKNAGKTSVIVGLNKALKKKIGYLKPFGDRLYYRKKRLWDHDYALMVNLFGLEDAPEDVTIGFDHSKIRYMYDHAATKAKLLELAEKTGHNKDFLFIEGGNDLACGVSVHLDAISVAKTLGSKLVLVLSGTPDAIVDDASFVKRCCAIQDIEFVGIVVNQVHDVEEFNDVYLEMITTLDMPVLGVIPYQPELTQFSVGYLAEHLFAKVIAGEGGLNQVVKNWLVGAMSADAALRLPVFQKENKLVITGGDRSDMILAALETNSVGVLLTNNVTPPANILSKASDLNIPVLLVSDDTFQVAKHIDDLEVLLSKEDTAKIDLLEQLIKKYVKLNDLTDL